MKSSLDRFLMDLGACGIGIALLATTKTGRRIVTRGLRKIVEEFEQEALSEVFERRRKL